MGFIPNSAIKNTMLKEIGINDIQELFSDIPKKIRDMFLIFPAIALFGILQIAFIILGFVYSFFSWVVLIIFYKAKFYHYIKIEVEKQEIGL